VLGRTGRIRPPGLFALYVAGYSGFRIFEETLREPAHHLLGLRLNCYVASLVCAAGLAWFARTRREGSSARGPMLVAAAWLASVAAGCGHSSIGHNDLV
jgi:prolipoprotein diacylglyceryltransferase